MTLPMESRIRDLFAAEQAAGFVQAINAEDIPRSFEAISDEWLSAHLRRDVPEARVVGHNLGPSDEGTNNRRRIHLRYNPQGEAAGLPRSIFAKATHGLRNRLMLGHSGAIHCEVTFYRSVRPLFAIETPRAFHAAYDPESFNSIILLEDIGDIFLDNRTHGSVDLMIRQLSLLAQLHAAGFSGGALHGKLGELPDWARRFRGLMQVDLETACSNGLGVCKHDVPPDLWARRDEIWPKTVRSLDHVPAAGPTLCHGDVHLHNWYLRPSGALGLSDWGVAHVGSWGRDLAYCLATGLTVDDRRAHERSLIAHYLAELARLGGPAISTEQALAACRIDIMTALAFWTMTAAPVAAMPDMQPLETARTFIARLSAAVADWHALDA